MTGGAAAGVLVGGSALKGMAKYQDTGSVGQTIGTVTSSVVFGAFKVGPGFGLAKLTGKQEYILILAQGVYEGASTHMNGKPFTEAAAKAGAKIAAEAGLRTLFKVPLIKTLFEKLPLPIVWVPDKASSLGKRWVDKASDVAMKATEKTAATLTSKVGLPAVGRAVMGSDGWASNTTSQDSNPVADAIIHDEMLLKFAICRMDRGIGHGW
ncbi:MAG: hypothetical protein NTZ14_06775 [Hyphomicrobiales bacterium]|nr:hypothetical protein [Hyphomicrobiales bacterium]